MSFGDEVCFNDSSRFDYTIDYPSLPQNGRRRKRMPTGAEGDPMWFVDADRERDLTALGTAHVR